jgi:DNA-binding transcriptional ArsR family regulator/rhodanese-related sulfurtransferase
MATHSHREFKSRLYAQFARVGKALASPHRLEVLELLGQGERTVESLAAELELSIANLSQHLKALREAALVESRKQGQFVFYRLADPAISELCRALRTVSERRLADLDRLVRDQFGDRATAELVSMPELLKRVKSAHVVVLDTRPAREYEAGHIAGAISVPIYDLRRRLKELPKDREYVAYCRGPYCVYADQAVELLKTKGRRASRLVEGFPEWRAAGLPIETGTSVRADAARR